MNAYTDRRRLTSGLRAESEPLRLLLADDDDVYRAYIAMLLKRVGFDVEVARDGNEVPEKLATGQYDAVVLDLLMPGHDGLQLIAQIRGNDATYDLYALMLTAREDTDTKLGALNAGFDDFLSKSASEAELLAKLEAARRVARRQRDLDATARELYGLATRDQLTSVCNRRFFFEQSEHLLSVGTPFSIVLFDLDEFKQVNDTYGHLAGDRVLQHVGALFQRNTRPSDLIARYGGDEFVMVLAGVTAGDAEAIAERLSEKVRALRWRAGSEQIAIGVTTGVSCTDFLEEPSLHALLDAADRDLYKNKWLRKHPDEVYDGSAHSAGVDLVLPLPLTAYETPQSAPTPEPRPLLPGTGVAPPVRLEE